MRSHDVKLPSGNSIVFREPTYRDRKVVLKDFVQREGKAGDSEAFSILAAYCITHYNGEPMQDPLPNARMDNWPLLDATYYTNLFTETYVMMSDDQVEEVKATAKKLLSNG